MVVAARTPDPPVRYKQRRATPFFFFALASCLVPTATSSDSPATPCVFQMRVINAFKSTLEDLQERRSVRSLHSLRSSRSSHPLSDIKYIDEDPKTPSPLSSNNTVRMVSPAAEDPNLVPPQTHAKQPLEAQAPSAPAPSSTHSETSI